MARQVEAVAEGFSYLMSPRWRDGRLWVSDVYAGVVLTVDARGRAEVALEVPQEPAGLGWLPDGRLLIVSTKDRRVLLREPSGELVTHGDLSGFGMAGRPHDMVVGPNGRAYVADFLIDRMRPDAPAKASRLYCIQPDGQAQVVRKDVWLPSGMVLFPDYTFVLAESRAHRLLAFDKGTDGSLRRRRTWATFGSGAAVSPAGLCGDINGDIWVADALGNRVLHVRPGGEILEEVSTGDQGVYACMLGGDDGRTLYLCTAPSFDERDRRAARESSLLAVRVDVPHGGLP